ncbi:cytochrome d ubiquinol oxidase subunit II [Kibdelosporangium philippinense]|uniref:Cytochrome d ubiquinol oxidase subunit II n=1 Tax=Kibdelosporangium philippinense TaxID=211113 RepID=A0ABS8ZND7_9PSEU|nr:cytochrome d ubiquinol oxidase subunit II [Kibdelosporangium philippinense]MCE7008470.1 cytochrome d ubiquinol oxidase subunit II [Kibdelosporangium philippinense]
MDFLWILTLAVLAAGYFALAGYDYGVGILIRLIGRDEPERRKVLGTVGPFFLGNEVWLVALAGILLGVFPKFEGRLFSGAYPVVLAIVLGVIVFTVAAQLRGRLGIGRKPFWDLMITVGAGVTAVAWGMLLGAMLEGLPLGPDGYPTGDFSGLIDSGTLLFGVLMFSLFTLHGAAFLAARSTDRLASRAKRVAKLLITPSAVTVLAVVVKAGFSLDLANPWVSLFGAGLVVLAVFAAGSLVDKRPMAAVVCTGLACVLPVFAVVAAHLPNALVSSLEGGAGLSYDAIASSSGTLAQIGWLALPVVPAVIGLQVVVWWIFRQRVDERTGLFW